MLSLPEVRNACAVYDHAKSQIVLFFEGERELNAGAIRKALEPLLPKYMFPSVCTQMVSLPVNPNGKTDRKALAATLES